MEVYNLFIWSFVLQEAQHSSQALQEEKEEVKRRLEEATARIVQLEEDLIGVTQKGLQKETELDRWVDANANKLQFLCYIFTVIVILNIMY